MTTPLSDENRKTLERVLWPLNDKYPTIAMSREDANALMNAVREEAGKSRRCQLRSLGYLEPNCDAPSAPPVQGDVREAVLDALQAAYEAGCHATHKNYEPDPDPSFTEAAQDYASFVDLDAILSAIPETQGEPVAWLLSCNDGTMPYRRKELIFHNPDGAAAKAMFNSWSALHWRTDVRLDALYTHPAPPIPAEVEELAGDLEKSIERAAVTPGYGANMELWQRLSVSGLKAAQTLRALAVQVEKARAASEGREDAYRAIISELEAERDALKAQVDEGDRRNEAV